MFSSEFNFICRYGIIEDKLAMPIIVAMKTECE